MSVLPDVPRLYTALAEILAALLYAQARPPRTAKPVYWGITAIWAILLAVFLHLTGHVPLAWWVPCMVTAIAAMYLYLWATREMNLREAGYSCVRAFVLAELAASVEWQLHCWLWPQRGGGEIPALLLLAAVYGALYGGLYLFERRRVTAVRPNITASATLMAVVMALTVFAVSNLSFIADEQATMSVYYIRTLVDIAGVLILSVQHEQLRETPAQRRIELTACLHGNSLALIQVENTYDGVIREKGGVFQSSKRKGDGVGLQSVRHIAEKSSGVSTVTYQDGLFCVKVMLCG